MEMELIIPNVIIILYFAKIILTMAESLDAALRRFLFLLP
jgi:hypothetical protein